jgi:IMP dehydrogenase/GMP reductase
MDIVTQAQNYKCENQGARKIKEREKSRSAKNQGARKIKMRKKPSVKIEGAQNTSSKITECENTSRKNHSAQMPKCKIVGAKKSSKAHT